VICGELRRHAALGMCSLCWQKNPDRAEVRGEHLIAELADPPLWVPDFVAFLAGRHCPSRAATMIGILARLLADEHPNDPQAVLDRARRPGRSIGSLARGLQDFFTERRLAPPTDHPERLAAGRRQRRIDATPQALRPAVQAFAASLLQNRQRARAAATRPRTDHTIEQALRTMRDLAVFLTSHRNKADWALVDQQDIEAFIAAAPGTGKSRLTFARQFFRFARNRRIVLIDPTRTLSVPTPRAFTGTTLTLDQQRDLFHRWTSDPTVHPHEALLGVLAYCTAPPASRSGRSAWTTSTPIDAPSGSVTARNRCRWTPPPGPSSNDASRTANPSAPRTRTWSSPAAPRPATSPPRPPTSATCWTLPGSHREPCGAPDWPPWSTPPTPNSSPRHSA
jgi:hypothetical protein